MNASKLTLGNCNPDFLVDLLISEKIMPFVTKISSIWVAIVVIIVVSNFKKWSIQLLNIGFTHLLTTQNKIIKKIIDKILYPFIIAKNKICKFYISRIARKKIIVVNNNENNMTRPETGFTIIKLNPTPEIFKLFYNFMKKSCNYNAYDTYEIVSQSTKNHTVAEKYGNISFDINNDITCKCLNDICFIFKNGEIFLEDNPNNNSDNKTNDNKDLSDDSYNVQFIQSIESHAIRKILQKIYNDIRYKSCNFYDKFIKFHNENIEKNIYDVDHLIFVSSILLCDYKNPDNILAIQAMFALCLHIQKLKLSVMINSKSDSLLTCDIFVVYTSGNIVHKYKIKSRYIKCKDQVDAGRIVQDICRIFLYDKFTNIPYGLKRGTYLDIILPKIGDASIDFNFLINTNSEFITNTLKSEIDKDNNTKAINNAIKFCVINKYNHKYSYDKLYDYFYEWYTNKLLVDNSDVDKVIVYNIKSVVIEEITKIDNPSYLEWI